MHRARMVTIARDAALMNDGRLGRAVFAWEMEVLNKIHGSKWRNVTCGRSVERSAPVNVVMCFLGIPERQEQSGVGCVRD